MQTQQYTIIIDEAQRAAITKALELAYPAKPGMDEDLLYLLYNFQDLPKEEADDPGTHHGFCL